MSPADFAPDSRTLELVDETARSRGGKRARSLFVVLEAARPSASGARFALDDVDEVVIGRGPRRSFHVLDGRPRSRVLTLPDRVVSSKHARIFAEGSDLVFEDLGSRNGSRVDDEAVRSRVVLADRSMIEVGGTFLCVHLEETAVGSLANLDLEGAAPVPLGTRTLLPAYENQLSDLAQVSIVGVPVLLLGETGTGKELLARAVHELSARPGAFVAVNCGALPGTLVEANLFGYVKGAFSGAVRDEPGLVRASHRGTLFLDEIAELPKASQAALLRVLQEHEVLPIGATKPVPVDLRVVAATHQRIEGNEERFRGDLYARLAGFTLGLPRLRDRREDLGVILADMLESTPGARDLKLSLPLARAMLSYEWRYNARELHQLLTIGVALVRGGELDVRHVPVSLGAMLNSEPSRSAPKRDLDPESRALRDDLVQHLERARGNISEISRAMGKTRMQIHRWMKRFGIDPESFRW